MSLGAGGIAVIPFAFLQYTTDHGPGLVAVGQLEPTALFLALYAVMIVFSLTHLALSFVFLKQLARWIGTPDYRSQLMDPLTNAALLAPFISVVNKKYIFYAFLETYTRPLLA